MRLYQTGALLTGAHNELVPRAGVLVDGPRIVAAGPIDSLAPDHVIPPDVVDLGDLTLMPGLVDTHVHLGFDSGPDPVARMKAETDTEQLILTLRSARELLSAGVTTARDLGARSFLDVAVRGDPRSDISVLHHVELVVARGAEHRPAPHRGQAGALAAPAGPGPR
jgi:imidazolonepropionase-like amidohydrolase